MNNIEIIKKNWGKISILEIQEELGIGLDEVLKLAYEHGLQNIETPAIGRKWTKAEDEFLKTYSNKLKVREASNLLYRSHYATYQRVKLLGLDQMLVTPSIKKKR